MANSASRVPDERSKGRAGRTLILALGNPILSDDGVGWEVADRLAAALPADRYDIVRESGATLDLLCRFEGYERLIIIDGIQLGTHPVGTVHRFTLEDFRSTVRCSSPHDLNFATAFAVGRDLGYDIPTDIRIYAIEVKELRAFAEGCTPEVRDRLEDITREIAAEL